MSNHRWIIGTKLYVVMDDCGRTISLDVAGANVHDTTFRPLIENQSRMIVLADQGFKAKEGNPQNLKVGGKGRWNERMIVEAVFSLLTTVLLPTYSYHRTLTNVLGLKKLAHRLLDPLKARIAYTCAIFNLCLNWNDQNEPVLSIVNLKL